MSRSPAPPDDPRREPAAGRAWAPDPAVVERFEAWRPDCTFREEGVPVYELPDPLAGVGPAGWEQRREELMEAFRSRVYGRRPAGLPAARFEVLEERADALGGAAVLRRVRAVFERDGRSFGFPFEVATPAESAGGGGGAVVTIDYREEGSRGAAEAGGDGYWPVRRILERGYVAAAFSAPAADPDRPDGHADGVRGFLAAGVPPDAEAWRTLSTWGWAAGVVADFLLESGGVDPARLAVAGHSRAGKAALWAAAEDTRFDAAFANESGCGGAALSRRRFGETIGAITSQFPHWFTPAFAGYEGREGELPVDQHTLLALLAPRGVYVSSATEDLWADPRGEYLSLVHAAPVFERLGVEAVNDPEPPPPGVPRLRGATGYHLRPGEHDLTEEDWRHFLGFLDARWGGASSPS